MDPLAQAAQAAAQAAARAAADATANERLVRLQEFDGVKSWTSWAEHTQKCKNAANWTDAITAQRVKLMMTGEALTWLRNQECDETEGLDTWCPDVDANGIRAPNLRELMEKRFSNTASQAELAKLRLTLTQRPTEGVHAFFDRVKSVQYELDKSLPLNFRINSKADYTIIHNQAVYGNFLCGLRSEISNHVTTMNANTVTLALEHALAYEQGHGGAKSKPKVAAYADQSELAAQGHQPNPQGAQMWAIRGGKGGAPQGRGGGGQAGQTQKPPERASTPFCLYCGYVGHDKPKCNIRKKDEAAGLFYPQSPHFQPGRVGRGGGRGRGGRGGATRGQVSHMATSPHNMATNTYHMATETHGDQNQSQWPPVGHYIQPQVPQPQGSTPHQFLQGSMPTHQANAFHNTQGGATAYQEQGAFRYFPGN